MRKSTIGILVIFALWFFVFGSIFSVLVDTWQASLFSLLMTVIFIYIAKSKKIDKFIKDLDND